MIEPIGFPGSDVFMARNIFTKKEIDLFLDVFLTTQNPSSSAEELSGQFKNIQINAENIDIAQRMIALLENALRTAYGDTFKPILLPDTRTSIKIQETGQMHPIHSDLAKTTHSGGVYGEMLAYSGILSLSDDYDGGEINFPGDGVFTKLDAGSALFFPSQKHIHQVERVLSGTRYTFLTFWEHCE